MNNIWISVSVSLLATIANASTERVSEVYLGSECVAKLQVMNDGSVEIVDSRGKSIQLTFDQIQVLKNIDFDSHPEVEQEKPCIGRAN